MSHGDKVSSQILLLGKGEDIPLPPFLWEIKSERDKKKDNIVHSHLLDFKGFFFTTLDMCYNVSMSRANTKFV